MGFEGFKKFTKRAALGAGLIMATAPAAEAQLSVVDTPMENVHERPAAPVTAAPLAEQHVVKMPAAEVLAVPLKASEEASPREVKPVPQTRTPEAPPHPREFN
jgi:hypothetical protein